MYNKELWIKRQSCMGAVDREYLRRFGELPLDTLEVLVNGGFSFKEAREAVERNVKLVSEFLIDQSRRREGDFIPCPYLHWQ